MSINPLMSAKQNIVRYILCIDAWNGRREQRIHFCLIRKILKYCILIYKWTILHYCLVCLRKIYI